MKYLAHFSFDQDKKEMNGYFTMIVSAPKPEEAMDKLEAKIKKLRKEGDIFSGIKEIFIDNLIEIENFPDKAILVRYESKKNDGFGRISADLFKTTEADKIKAFYWTPNENDGENDLDELEIAPFVVFKD